MSTARRARWLTAWWLLTLTSSATAQAVEGLGARATTRARPEAGGARVRKAEAQRAAGTLGEPARALATLPGVARSSFDSGELVIWGAPASEHRVYVDGIEIPALFHAGGVRTTVHPALIESVALTPAAAGPSFGRALGGAMELETSALREEPALLLAADAIDSSVEGRGALGPVRGLWAGRIGYLDRLQEALAPETRDIVAVPAYADAAMRLETSLADGATITASWLGSHDRSRAGNAAADPALRRTRVRTRDFQLAWLELARRYRDGARARLAPYAGVHHRIEALRFDERPAMQALSELRYGARVSYALRGEHFGLRMGLDGAAARSEVARFGSLAVPEREGELRVFGEPPGHDVALDEWSAHDVSLAPYASVRLALGPIALTPGVRLETYALSASRSTSRVAGTPPIGTSSLHVYPEPRLEATAQLGSRWSVAARVGIHHQPPRAEDRSAVFGNPELGPSSSQALAAGPALQLGDAWRAELIGFYRRASELVVRSRARPPLLATALTQDGRARSFGAQLAIEHTSVSGLSGSLAYTLSRSERGEHGGALRLAEHDQTHVLAALLGYGDGGFALGVRARLSTGAPRADVEGAYYNARDDRYEPSQGEDMERGPWFFALDVHGEQRLLDEPVRLIVYLDVLNLTDHENVEEVAYGYDYATRRDVVGWPVLAVLGARLEL